MILVALGGVGVLSGAALFVAAFRAGQREERERERSLFRASVLAMGLGSALFVVALLTSGG